MTRANFRFAGVVTVLLVLVTAWVATAYDLPIRDHDGLAGPSWLQLPVIGVLSVFIDVFPRAARRSWRAPAEFYRVAVAVLHERWPQWFVRFAIAGMLVSYLVNSAFRNLKSYVPFVNERLWDDTLDRLDRTLWLGHDPATVLHDLLGTGWVAPVLSAIYVSWLVLIPFTLAIALIWSRRAAASAWYVTALALNWALGLVAYYLVPSLGPVYASPERFSDLPDTYVAGLQKSMIVERSDLLSDPSGTPAVEPIAAFASLHVAVVVTMLLMAYQLGAKRWVCVVAWAYLALTTLATLYLGWHYFVDDLGGVAIGVTAVWMAGMATGHRMRGGNRASPEHHPSPIAAPHVQASARRTSNA